MIRFFAKPQNIDSTSIILDADDREHIRSLRLSPTELFVVCDGNSTDYICCLGENKQDSGTQDSCSVAQILSRKKTRTEPSVKCTVYIAYAKNDRLEYATQKSVELGANKIVLFSCMRCIARPDNSSKKTDRLQKIALEAAKQCGRGIIPEVSYIGDFNTMISSACKDDMAILCYEEEKNLRMRTVLEHYFPTSSDYIEPADKVHTVSVITGPEGGFEPSEAEFAKSKDISVVSFGRRILRAETAPVVALATIMYHTENL